MCVRERDRQKETERAREREFKKEWRRMSRKRKNGRKRTDTLSGFGDWGAVKPHKETTGSQPYVFYICQFTRNFLQWI